MKNTTNQWLERAAYDFSTANAMLKMRKYLYVAFMCQQAVEKTLKAIMAKKGARIPLIHGLRKLAEMAGVEKEMTPAQLDILERLTPFAIKARYGSYKKRLSEICNREMAASLLHDSKEIIRWLEKKM